MEQSVEMDKSRVIQICESRVKIEKLVGCVDVLCIDGTSGTMKTSIANRTGLPVSKIQRHMNKTQFDSYALGVLSYISTGYQLMPLGETRINDRGIFNVLEWKYIWCVLESWIHQIGNHTPNGINGGVVIPEPSNDIPPSDIPTPDRVFVDAKGCIHIDDQNTFLTTQHRDRMMVSPFYKTLLRYIRLFECIRDNYPREMLSDRINCIAIVDSNYKDCDERRRLRNEGSDVERLQMRHYTAVQNLAYSVLYPHLYICLSWFGETTPRATIVDGIAEFMRRTVERIAENNYLKRRKAPAMLPLYTLPVFFQDFTMANSRTHVHRQKHRWAVSYLLELYKNNNEISLSDALADLKSRIPAYLTVKNIVHPNGMQMEDIVSQSCSSLLQSDLFSKVYFDYGDDDDAMDVESNVKYCSYSDMFE